MSDKATSEAVEKIAGEVAVNTVLQHGASPHIDFNKERFAEKVKAIIKTSNEAYHQTRCAGLIEKVEALEMICPSEWSEPIPCVKLKDIKAILTSEAKGSSQ